MTFPLLGVVIHAIKTERAETLAKGVPALTIATL